MNIHTICIFTWGLSGGAFANVTVSLARGFIAAGIRNIYILYLSHGPGRNIEIPEEIRTISLGVKHSACAPVFLARVLRKIKPDVLISMSAFINLAAIIGLFLANNRKTRLIISEHATMSYKVYTEHKKSLKFFVLPYLARVLYPRANGVVTISSDILKDLTETMGIPLKPEKTCVIVDPVELERIFKLAREPVKHPWFTNKKYPVILSVGRLAKQKNYSLLLKAYALIRKKRNVRLVIAGEGPEREHLKNLALNLGIEIDIDILGYVENPYKFMARSDVFVLPSEEEAFGLVLVEAMACGIPVVAADAMGGGPRTVLGKGEYGILVPPNNVDALADSIQSVLSSKYIHDQLVVAGRQQCKTFRPEAIARRWLSFIRLL